MAVAAAGGEGFICSLAIDGDFLSETPYIRPTIQYTSGDQVSAQEVFLLQSSDITPKFHFLGKNSTAISRSF